MRSVYLVISKGDGRGRKGTCWNQFSLEFKLVIYCNLRATEKQPWLYDDMEGGEKQDWRIVGLQPTYTATQLEILLTTFKENS